MDSHRVLQELQAWPLQMWSWGLLCSDILHSPNTINNSLVSGFRIKRVKIKYAPSQSDLSRNETWVEINRDALL